MLDVKIKGWRLAGVSIGEKGESFGAAYFIRYYFNVVGGLFNFDHLLNYGVQFFCRSGRVAKRSLTAGSR